MRLQPELTEPIQDVINLAVGGLWLQDDDHGSLSVPGLSIQNFFERLQESGILFRQADGDPQHATLDVADDDALTEQRLKHLPAILADINEEKVGFARQGAEAKRNEPCPDGGHLSLIHRAAPGDVFVVL